MSMVTVFLWRGVSISTLVHQVQLVQSCSQQAVQACYNGNYQQFHFIPNFIWNDEHSVLPKWHWLIKIEYRMLRSFGRFKQHLLWSLHLCLWPQSCWIHWVSPVAASRQRSYVTCSSKGHQQSWGINLLSGEIKQLVVEWTGMSVQFSYSYKDFDHIYRYGGSLELRIFFVLQFRPYTS